MSKIYFKFKAAKEYDSVIIDTISISVFDLKREIILAKKLGNGVDFDLAIQDAQSTEGSCCWRRRLADDFCSDYDDDNYQIPRNSSVLVRRIPVGRSGSSAQRYLTSVAHLPRGMQVALGSQVPLDVQSMGKSVGGNRTLVVGGVGFSNKLSNEVSILRRAIVIYLSEFQCQNFFHSAST